MLYSTRARAEDVRALVGAIALGSGAGLLIGAAYLLGSGDRPHPHPAPASAPVQDVATRTMSPQPAAAKPVQTAQAAPSHGFGAYLRGRFQLVAALSRVTAKPFHFDQVASAPNDQNCLAEAVYFEARGESEAGQQAVAQVVLNRVRHPAFPKTVCGVVHQRSASSCQFAFACTADHPVTGSAAWRRAETVASAALHGAVMAAVGDATHFQSARGGAFAGLMKVAQVGAHVFYRFGGRAGASSMFSQTPVPSGTLGSHVELARLDTTRLTAPASAEARPADVTAPAEIKLIDAKPPALRAELQAGIAKPVAAKPVDVAATDAKAAAGAPVKAPAALVKLVATGLHPVPAAPPVAPADAKPAVTVALAQS